MVFIAKPKPTIFRCTGKQQEVMRHILKAADEGRFLYLGELNQMISWGPVRKISLSSVIRHLEAHGFLKRLYARGAETDVKKMIEGTGDGDQAKVRGMRMHIVPTPFAYSYFRPKPVDFLDGSV